jgi:multidrug efflux pump
VRQFGVTTPKQSPTPLMYASLYSSDNRCDTLYLRNYVTLNIKDELSRLVGIGDVGVYGPGDYSMRLWLDPNELASRNLTATDVLNAVHEQNVQVWAGQLGAEPSPKTTEFLLSINVRGRPRTEQEFGSIVIKSGNDGQVVHLSDVARIELEAGDYTMRVFEGNKTRAGQWRVQGVLCLVAAFDRIKS